MSLLRKLRRQTQRKTRQQFAIEALEPRLMLNADLAIHDFGIDTAPPFLWGGNLAIGSDLINSGDTDAGQFDVMIALSQDNIWDGLGSGDNVLDTFTVSSLPFDSTNDANISVNDRSITLPSSGTDGDYNLLMIIDDANTVVENDDSNNIGSIPIQIGSEAPSGPDITVSNFQSSGPFVIGQPFDVANDIQNPGTDSTGSFNVNIILSTDDIIDPNDTILGSRTISDLAAGTTDAATTSVTIPDDGSVAEGTYHLGIMADPDNLVSEIDEYNNIMLFQITVEAGTPPADIDLQPTDLSWPDGTQFLPGSSVDISFTENNYGSGAAAGHSLQLLLSDNDAFSGTPTILAEWTSTGLDAGVSSQLTQNVIIPSDLADGQYYLGVKVDSLDEIAESVEDNNMISSPVWVGEGTAPVEGVELQPTLFQMNTTDAVVWGGTYNFDMNVTNIGNTDAGEFSVALYVSQDNVIDATDTLLQTLTINSLIGGGMSPNNVDVPLVTTEPADGDYNFIMVVDSDNFITEPNEDDNISVMPVHIGVDSSGGGIVELQASLFDFHTQPDTITWSGSYDLDTEVKNIGDQDASAFDVKVYLSGDDLLDDNDVFIDGYQVDLLTAGSSWNQNMAITLPASGTDGDYYLIMSVDDGNVIAEPSEDDNNSIMPLHIGEDTGTDPGTGIEGIDLVAEAMDFPPEMEFIWGQTITMPLDAENIGNTAAGAFNIGMYLSTDSTLDSQDILLGEVQVPGLNATSESLNDINITLPAAGTLADGAYYLITYVDSGEAVAEVDEANNIASFSGNFAETPTLVSGIDLTAAGVDIETGGSPMVWGQTYTAGIMLMNKGDTDAGAFTTTIVLSTDELYDTGDTIIGTLDIASATAGGLIDNDTSVTLPAEGTLTDGNYFVLMVVDSDNAVSEVDEDNNISAYPEYIGQDGGGEEPPAEGTIELQPGNFTLISSAPFMWGNPIDLNSEVRNIGDTTAGAFNVTVYLSQDDVIDGSDTPLYSYTVDALSGGTTSSENISVSLPADGTDGNYNLIALVDSDNQINEPSEDDNQVILPIMIGEDGTGPVQGIELVAESTDLPQIDLVWGQTYMAAVDISNVGDTAAPAFNITVALSTDDIFDSGDTVLFELTGISLEGQAESTNDANITLPSEGFSDGSYYILVVADSQNQVEELDELNNTAVQAVNIVATPNLTAGIDLTKAEFSIDIDPQNTGFQWGQTYNVAADIINKGDTEAGAFEATIFLSTDDQFDSQDTIVGTLDISGLMSGTISTNDVDITLPAEGFDDGAYFLVLVIDSDNSVTEIDETNNIAAIDLWVGEGGGEEPPTGTGVDLTATQVYINNTGIIAWGDTLNLSVNIDNIGDTDAGSFSAELLISQDDIPDEGDILLMNVDIPSLPAGNTYNTPVSVLLPDDGRMPGEYNLIVRIDSSNIISEANEDNNNWITPLYIETGAPTDAVDLVSDADGTEPIPFDLIWGQTYEIPVDVMNEGGGEAGPFDVQVVLSQDAIYDEGDLLVATVPFSGVAPWSESITDITATLPAAGTMPDGAYHMIYIIDSGNTVTETNEDNNIGYEQMNILSTPNLVSGVELLVVDFDSDMEADASWGSTIPVLVELYNQGDTASGEFTITVSLSQDGTLENTDLLLSTAIVPNVDSNTMYSTQLDIPLPGAEYGQDGSYFLILSADSNNSINESDETNNSDDFEIYIMGGNNGEPVENGTIDLMVDQLIAPPPPVYWGGHASMDLDISNTGDGFVDQPFSVNIYISDNDVIDDTDWLAGQYDMGGIGPQINMPVQVLLDFPPEGTFASNSVFVGAIVDHDNTVDELDESNNIMFVPMYLDTKTTVDGIDLAVPFVHMPGPVNEGQEAEVEFGVENWGQTDAGEFNVDFYFSDDPMFEIDDQGNVGSNEILLGSVNVAGVSAGGSEQLIATLTIPENLQSNFYNLMAIANLDKSVDEDVYDNNLGIGFVDIMSSGSDLAVTDMMMPYDAKWGETFNADIMVENRGANTVDVTEVGIYLSQDPDFSDDDTLLTMVPVNDLAGASQQVVSTQISLPSDQEGKTNLTLIAKIDPNNSIEENDEGNNLWFRGLYIGTAEQANVSAWPMIMFDGDPGAVDWGASITVDTTVQNNSNVTTDSFAVGYYLSLDENISDDDTLLLTEDLPNGLMPFEHYFQTVSLTMPSSNPSGGNQGEWYLIAQADANNVINEFDENDNSGFSPLFIGSKPADLEGWMQIDNNEVVWGESVNITGQIENHGGTDVGSFDINYYLTNDPELSGAILLATQTVNSLAAESSTSVIDSVTLPSDPGEFSNGTVFIVGVIDENNTVDEFDEANNFMGDWLTTDMAAAELVPFFIQPQSSVETDTGLPPAAMGGPIYWDQPLDIYYELGNQGNIAAESFQVSFYLTTNDGNMGQAYHLGDEQVSQLEPDAIYSHDLTLSLPAAADVPFVEQGMEDGSYMLVMQVDSGQNITEMIEDNNQFMMPLRLEMQRGTLQITDSLNDPNDMILDMGPVLEGETVTESFTIENVGVGPLNISGISNGNPDFAVSQNGTAVTEESVFTIDAGASLAFDVTFNAQQTGHQDDIVNIMTDDPTMPQNSVSVWADVATAPADLAVSSISAPKSANWGDEIKLQAKIENLETSTAEEAMLDIMLGDPADGTGMFTPIWSESLQNITAGQAITRDIDVVLPAISPFGYGGQVYLQAVINPVGSTFDSNLDNNAQTTTLEITTQAYGKPDLTFSWYWVPPDASWGSEIEANVGIRNSGMADAGAFSVDFYLSEDDILDNSDILINDGEAITIPGLVPMGETESQINITLPDGEGSKMYYVITSIDPDNKVDEEFEDNNIAIGRFNIGTPQTMDLSADAISGPETATVGSDLNISLEVSNTGEEDAQDVRIEYFLTDPSNDDPAFWGNYIGSTSVTIPAGATTTVDYTTNLPEGLVTPGQDYQLRAVVDADMRYWETNEDNNMILTSEPMAVSGGNIDLTGSFDNAPDAGGWNEIIPVELVISNNGDMPAAPFFVDMFLSSDTELSPQDFYLNSQMIYSLDQGQDQTITMDITLPGQMANGDGDYYLLANIDGGQNILEINEDNNIVANALHISGIPDIALQWEDAPFTANFSQTITVTDKVMNQGDSASGAFDISYYLSNDDLFDSEDTMLYTRTIDSLASQAETSTNTDLTLPDDGEEGNYFLIAIADPTNAIEERLEKDLPEGTIQENNISVTPLNIISEGTPELKATELSTIEQSDWGESIVVQNSIANLGTADAGIFSASFYLSDNASITARDYLLGTRTITGLAAGTTNQQSTILTLPEDNPFGENGDFYIGIKVDSEGEIAETNEDNNIMVSDDTVTIGDVIGVDLVAAFVTAPPSGEAGKPIDIFYEVYNAGSSQVENFDIDFYLTSDGTIDDTATLIGSTTVDSLADGAFRSETVSLNLPESTVIQNYVIAMQINGDQTLEERTYDNNTVASFMSFEVMTPVSLDVAAISAAADAEANWGDTITVNYEFQSNEPLTDTVAADITISQPEFQTGEYTLGQIQLDLSDGADQGQIELTLPSTSPFGRDGGYTLQVTADPNNEIEEQTESNNTADTNITLGSNSAELVALNISGVPKIGAGDSFEAFNELANYGSVTADNFDIYFYLTADNNSVDTTSDTLLGMRHIDALAANASNWTMTSLTIPANVEDGDYYLAMIVDNFDDVSEISESNNTIFSDNAVMVRTVSIDPDDNEPNNTSGTATSLTIDENGVVDTINATLHTNTDKDYYSFTVPTTADGFMRISVIPDETLNVAVFVYDSSNNMIGGADTKPDFGGSEVYSTFALTPGRSYDVLVKAMGDSAGAYTMDLELGIGTAGDAYESNDSMDTAYYLGNAAISFDDATIHTGTDIDYYQFAVPATSTGDMTISVTPDPGMDAILQLFDSDGNLIGSSDSGGASNPETVDFAGTIGTSYYAKVTSWANSTGTYSFALNFTEAQLPDSYEPNDDFDSASSPSTLILPSLTIHNGDIDYFAFTIPDGDTQIAAYLFGSQGLDASMELYDSNGNSLRSTDRTGANGNETLLADGFTGGDQLYLAVRGENDTTGHYSLEIDSGTEVVGDGAEPDDLTTTAFPLILQDNQLSMDGLSIHDSEDRDYYSFTAPSDTDGTAVITVTPDSSTGTTLNVSLGLLDDSTTIKSTDAAGAGETETLTISSGLEGGRTYLIDVNGWGSTGDYQLNIITPVASEAVAAIQPQTDAGAVRGIGDSTAYLEDGTPAEIAIVEEIANANDDDLSFGSTPVGTSLSYTFTVLNTGGSALTISDAAINGTDSDAFSVSPSSAAIDPGESQEFTVSFAPDNTSLYSDATLVLTNNDTDEGTYSLALSGTGTVSTDKPDIDITDQNAASLSSLDFGDTLIDNSSTGSFLINNTGTADLTVSSAVISGDDAGEFNLLYPNLAGKTSDDYSIASAGQKLIQIQYSPTEAGSHSAVLTLASNDPDETTVTINLVGSGVEPNLVVDQTPTDGTVANETDQTIAFDSVTSDGPGGQYETYPINIVNTGTSDLTISSITFSANSAFSISGVATDGLTIAANETYPATVIFDPTLTGTFTDTMIINSDDPDTPAMQFTLTGEAIQAATQSLTSGQSFSFTDKDGDLVNVTLKNGTADLTFDGSSADGSNISSIDLTGTSKKSSLVISITTAAGNGTADIGDISTDDAFASVIITGSVDSLAINGTVKSVSIDGVLGDFSAEGTVTTFVTGGLNGDITAGAFKKMTINGAVSDTSIITNGTKQSSVGTVSITGDVTNTTINTGMVKALGITGDVSDLTLATTGDKSQVGTMTIDGNAEGLDLTTQILKGLTVTGNILDSSLTVTGTKAKVGAINVTGSLDMDITSAGAIKSIGSGGDFSGDVTVTGTKGQIGAVTVAEDLTASLRAVKSIKSINVGGDITADEISVQGTGKGKLTAINAGGDVSVTNLDIDGNIKNLTVGSENNPADLSGTINLDGSLGTLRIFGDLNADITTGGTIKTIETNGQLAADADITSAGTINKMIFGSEIRGNISVGDGAGSIKQFQRIEGAFINATTGLADLPGNHINANLQRTKWSVPSLSSLDTLPPSLSSRAGYTALEHDDTDWLANFLNGPSFSY